MASTEETSSSTQSFLSALILYGIIGLVLFVLFTLLRPKQPDVYQPKTKDLPDRSDDERPPEVAAGYTAWAAELWSRPQSFFVQYIGIDGYLYTRYIGVFCSLSFLGGLMLMPILLPVNATNGSDNEGFDLLSFANVTNDNRYYAHAFLSWFFFGLVIWVIYKELVFYTSFRHSVQTSPLYDGMLSSRTVLLTDIPTELYEKSEVRKIFPHVSRIWFARDNTELADLVNERAKLQAKYEETLNSIVKASTKNHMKLTKKGKPLPEFPEELIGDTPKHRLGKIPFIGKKVDTVDYAIEELPKLNEKIARLQADPTVSKQLGSVFLEFTSQLEAQRAYQSIPFQQNLNGYCAIGVAPEDIVWSNLSLGKAGRHTKRLLANTFLTLMIIFWAIPVAIVGMISNITFLTDKISFLSFINDCPSWLLGLITGILPTVALIVLMSLVPVFIKTAGKMSGIPTVQQIDLYCQTWYFGFQVIQVFLVVTLASAASSVVSSIIDDPSSAMTLLAAKLPKASNFYISYFLLQGLYAPAFAILQAVPLLLSHALSFLLNTPRKKWRANATLNMPSFGVIYPPLQLLVVLYFCYSLIAPLVLVFSTLALGMSYVVNLYLFTYVKGPGAFDQRGRNYPKALLQTFTGLYLAEVCLIGLFILAKTWGPVAIEALIIAVTIAAHTFLKHKFVALFDTVPISAIHEARGDGLGVYPKDHGLKEICDTGKNYLIDNAAPEPNIAQDKPKIIVNDGRQPNDSLSSRDETLDQLEKKQATEPQVESVEVPRSATAEELTAEFKKAPRTFFQRFTNPELGYGFSDIRSKLPVTFNYTPVYNPEFLETAYYDEAIKSKESVAWIPKDSHGVSTYEIEKAFGKVMVSDQGAELNEKGKLNVTGNPPDYVPKIRI